MTSPQIIHPLISRKRVSMRDVATRCGVSISTVSLVLSGDARIPEDTTRKVLQTVKAMEYRPSVLARSLAKRGSRTIGVILPEFAFQRNQAFYYQALQGIHAQTQPAGYKMLVEAANKGFLDRRYYLRLLKEQSADGIIYLAAGHRDTFLSEMKKERYPFVLLGSRVEGSDLPTFTADEVAGAKLAARHLISLGHRRIGCISGSLETSNGRDREQGYLDALAEAGLVPDSDLIVRADFDITKAELAVEFLLKLKATAIFAASDVMAYGVLRGLNQKSIQVPRDIAVVGIDDLELSAWVNPPLTTVRIGIGPLAAQATQYVLKSVENHLPFDQLLHDIPPPELIVRSSCGAQK